MGVLSKLNSCNLNNVFTTDLSGVYCEMPAILNVFNWNFPLLGQAFMVPRGLN